VNETIQKIQTQIRQSDTDLQDKVSIINGDIRSNTRAIIETKNISISKAEKEHKHSIEDIDRLQSTIDAINDNIDDRTTIGEVKETLKEFYTKQETYSKKEINAKLDNIKPSVSLDRRLRLLYIAKNTNGKRNGAILRRNGNCFILSYC
jgi:hypothetical protein